MRHTVEACVMMEQPERQASEEARLRVRLLGDFAVLLPGATRDETPWERFDTTSQVLKFLLLRPRLRCHPSVITDALWPDVDADKAAERLQFHVKRLRTLLRPERLGIRGPRLVAHDKTLVALDIAAFGPIDALEFTSAATAALAGHDRAACRAALARYGGELLPYDLAWTWTAGPRRALAGRRLALLSHAARLAYEAADLHDAIALLTELLASDPCDERAARLLMECYHVEGERAAAARVYHTLRAHLQDELHVLPGARTEELYAAIRHAPVEARAQPTWAPTPAQRRRRPRPTELARLLGRDEELAHATVLLDTVRQRGGSYALVVQGEAGTGKTHLAHEILNRARARGYSVLAGFAHEGGALPYAPLVEALRVHAANVPEEALRTALAAAPGAAALLPKAAARLGLVPPAPASNELLRRDLVHAILALCTGGPAALLLDDLHDADRATLAVLHDLIVAGSAVGLLVVATVRAEPALPSMIEEAVAEWRRRGAGDILTLRGLPATAAPEYLATILGRPPTPELAAEVHAKTGGNPFLMAEVARELQARGILEPRGASWGLPRGRLPVPESVRGLARARLGVLAPEARRLAALAAVAGAQPVTVLARLGGWGTAQTLDLLDELVAAGIFEEREGYRFRHEMLREAVYDAQGAERRALLHAQVAAALEEKAGTDVGTPTGAPAPEAVPVAELARHYLQGGPDVADRAAHYAALAGDRAAAIFAHREAATWYREALERTPPEERAHLYERLGAALAASGEQAAAVDALAAALPLTAEEPVPRARALWRLGAALMEMGAHEEAGRRLAESEMALRSAEGGLDEGERDLLRGRIYGARARLALETTDLDAARQLATRALQALEEAPGAVLDRLEVRNALAGALFHQGRLDEAGRHLAAQLPDAQALGHPDMLCRLHANRSLILLLQGNLPAALEANEQATVALGSYHDAYRQTHLLADRGQMQIEHGAWDDALAALGTVIAAAERAGWPHLATRAHADVAIPLAARGRLDGAAKHLEQAIAVAASPGFNDETPLITALVRRAALEGGRGRLTAAADDLARAQAAAERTGRPQELVDVQLGLSELCRARGDENVAEAEEHARAALALAAEHGFVLYRGRALLALARAMRQQDRAGALHALDEAIALFRACDARPDLAAALLARAKMLPPGPDADAARAEGMAIRKRLGITG